MDDIRIIKDGNGFLFRAAGIWIHDGKVLLQTDGSSGWAFPGGHVKLGESAAQSLERELFEELGAEIVIGELLGVSEDRFEWNGINWQSVCLYFEIKCYKLPQGQIPIAGPSVERGSPVVFEWHNLANLNQIELYPPEAAQWIGYAA